MFIKVLNLSSTNLIHNEPTRVICRYMELGEARLNYMRTNGAMWD